MLTVKKMQDFISLLLLIGILISCLLVLLGGTLYLYQNGDGLIDMSQLQASAHPTTIGHIWQDSFTLSPIGLIELGLLALVLTQFLRVALLMFFYAYTRDYPFIIISAFILFFLIYSFIWPH